MKKLKIDLENCYGIRTLKKEFDFSDRNMFVVYAPNGSMKTSLAQVFQDLSKDTLSEDRIFKNRITKRIIKDENNIDIGKDQVFVIEPYNQDYKSTKISTLLVNKELKDRYDNIYRDINDKKEILLKELRSLSGLKKDSEEIFSNDIAQNPNDFYLAISYIQKDVLDGKESNLSKIGYSKIFNEKVMALLESQDLREKLAEYIKTYDMLVSSSMFFKKGVFNHNNASEIAKNLKENGFFKANHSIFISVKENEKNTKMEIKTEADLEKVIQKEKEAILKDTTLAKAFDEIDKKLKNKELRELRDYLEQNRDALIELYDLSSFKKKIWVAYLIKNNEKYNNLMAVYSNGKREIEEIITQAKREETKWQEVIDIFNERFLVPFKVKMENQGDVILKSEAPNIKFEFINHENDKNVMIEEKVLWDILSTGEARALYILNIIFEVEARKKAKQETLFIVDDIADSFDYKNKYAIIEYLNDISKENYFYQIILTHNFDFFRNVSSRLNIQKEGKLHITKTSVKLELVRERYTFDPFRQWKENLNSNNEMLIASIPFLRNLARYCGFEDHYNILTKLLHLKSDTNAITVGHLERSIKEILRDERMPLLQGHDRVVKNLIYDTAGNIYNDAEEVIELEKKVVLSIAIRLKMEEFLIKEINDDVFVSSIDINQTIKLINKYKEKFPENKKIIKLAERVNLMTPENIHINSFMYEPLLDMSGYQLKELFKKVSDI